MLSIPDMAILAGAALLLFGPEQLPKVMRKAGAVMREVQNTSSSFIREMERAADLHEDADHKPYTPSAYEPPYDASGFETTAAFDAVGTAHGTSMEGVPPHANGSAAINYEPAAPDPDPQPPVGEKLAEPRPALDLQKPPVPHDVEPFDPPPHR